MAQLNKKIMAVAVAVVFCLLAAFWPHEREADVLKIEQQDVTASEKKKQNNGLCKRRCGKSGPARNCARKQGGGSYCRRRRNDGRSQ